MMKQIFDKAWHITVLGSVMTLIIAGGSASPAFAQTPPRWASNVFRGVDCNPASGSSGLSSSTTVARCSGDGGLTAAAAQATTTSMKWEIATAANAQAGDYNAFSGINDSILVSGRDSRLDGTMGKLSMTFAVDGMMSAGNSRLIFAPGFVTYMAPGYWSSRYADSLVNLTYQSIDGKVGSITESYDNIFASVYNPIAADIAIEGTVTFIFDVTLGTRLNTSLQMGAYVSAPGQHVGFFNTASLAGIAVRDQYGALLDVALSADSGTPLDGFLPTASAGVPEPATWAMLVLGFGAIGGALRRRGMASIARTGSSNSIGQRRRS